MIKHKICPNCLSVMFWNMDKERWECHLCGYSEELENKFKGFKPGYIN